MAQKKELSTSKHGVPKKPSALRHSEKRRRAPSSGGQLLTLGGVPPPSATPAQSRDVRALSRQVMDAKRETWIRRYGFDIAHDDFSVDGAVPGSLVSVNSKTGRGPNAGDRRHVVR